MQNKYIRTIFYSGIIIITVFCGVLCLYRYKADLYFDLARKAIPSYTFGHESSAYVQWAYNEAVKCNPYQSDNYKNILGGTFHRMIREHTKKKIKS